jgi:hypothetical protein
MKLKTWDGNNINDATNYDAVLNANFYGLPGINAILGKRHGSWPILSGVERPGRELNFEIYIRGGSSLELEQWFDPEDEAPKQLIAEDNAGGNDRFIYAICTELREVPFSAGLQYAVTVQIDGDVRWRETSITTASAWDLTATGETKVVANGGQDKAYPILKIQPTSGKTGAYNYKRWIPVRWNSNNSSGGNYPVDIVQNAFDTDALTTAKMQADGDDLRVWVNGTEADRWLQDMDTITTQVWVNLIFQPKQEVTLDGDIDDSVTTITANEDISGFPSSGIIQVEGETIAYSGKDNTTKQFLGCTRGAKASATHSHDDNDDIWWIQHEIWILYGNAAASTPVVDDDYKPMFELDSSNSSWVYENFKDDDSPNRPGTWQTTVLDGDPTFYGGNRGASANPWGEIGTLVNTTEDESIFYIQNPCGITAANFTNGEQYAWNKDFFEAKIKSFVSSWIDEYTIPDPSDHGTWDSWSRDETLTSDATRVGLWLALRNLSSLECSDVTLTIDDDPQGTTGFEQTNYDLDCTITNETTGEAVRITNTLLLDEELEVDSDAKTIILLDDSTNQFQALAILGSPRRDWLALDVGNNTLRFDDVGTGNVTITVTWWERYYE